MLPFTVKALVVAAVFWNAFMRNGKADAFAPPPRPHQCVTGGVNSVSTLSASNQDVENHNTKLRSVTRGSLLSDLPSPSVLIELDLLERFLAEQEIVMDNNSNNVCDDFLRDPSQYLTKESIHQNSTLQELGGSVYVHTSVISTQDRDEYVQEHGGSGKHLIICQVDATPQLLHGAGGAYLGLGLANHHVGGYYWARSMGIGASLPAHGITFGVNPRLGDSTRMEDREDAELQGGYLYWKTRGPGADAKAPTSESSNSNDGKRSEWADFLKVGDTVQLVPKNAAFMVLDTPNNEDYQEAEQPFRTLIGMRRTGRPLGADPIVADIWDLVSGSWERRQ